MRVIDVKFEAIIMWKKILVKEKTKFRTIYVSRNICDKAFIVCHYLFSQTIYLSSVNNNRCIIMRLLKVKYNNFYFFLNNIFKLLYGLGEIYSLNILHEQPRNTFLANSSYAVTNAIFFLIVIRCMSEEKLFISIVKIEI